MARAGLSSSQAAVVAKSSHSSFRSALIAPAVILTPAGISVSPFALVAANDTLSELSVSLKLSSAQTQAVFQSVFPALASQSSPEAVRSLIEKLPSTARLTSPQISALSTGLSQAYQSALIAPPAVSIAQTSALDVIHSFSSQLNLSPSQTTQASSALRDLLSDTPLSILTPQIITARLRTAGISAQKSEFLSSHIFAAYTSAANLPPQATEILSSSLSAAQSTLLSLSPKLKLTPEQIVSAHITLHSTLTSHPTATLVELENAFKSSGFSPQIASVLASSSHQTFSQTYAPVHFLAAASQILSTAPLAPNEASQILNQLFPLLGTNPASLPDHITRIFSASASTYIPSEYVESISQIAQIFDPHAPPVLRDLRSPLVQYLHSTSALNLSDIPGSPENLLAIKSSLSSSFSTLPSHYPESRILFALQPLLTTHLAASPATTIPAAVDLILSSSGGRMSLAQAFSVLSPAIPALLSLHPELASFHLVVSTRLTRANVTPQLAAELSDHLLLFKLYRPDATPQEVSRYLQLTFLPKLEANKVSSPEILLRDLGEHFTMFNYKLKDDAAAAQYLYHQLRMGGLPSPIAKILSKQSVPFVKAGYFLAGFAGAPSTPADKLFSVQNQAFQQLFPLSVELLRSKQPSQTSGLNLQNLNPQVLFSNLFRQFGPPQAFHLQSHLGSLNLPGPFSDLLKFVSQKPRDLLHPRVLEVLERFSASPLGRQFFSSTIGKQISLSLTKSGITGAVRSATGSSWLAGHRYTIIGNRVLSPVKSIAKAAWGKLAKTVIGKTVTSIAKKIAIKLGFHLALQAVGSTVPVIGNVAAFVVGLVLDVTWGVIKKLAKKIKENAPMIIGAIIGLIGAQLAGLSITGSLAATGVGGFVGSAFQSFFTGTGPGVQSLQQIASTGGSIITGVVTVIAGVSVLPIVITVLVIPIIVTFVVFIINSGAYVIPATPLSFFFAGDDSGVGGGGGGGGGGWGDPSSCPIDDGIITYYSYNSSNDTGHGSTPYWQGWTPCKWALPQDAPGCYGPSIGVPSVCSGVASRCPYYGYAMDVKAPSGGVADVKLPLLNGQSVRWNFSWGKANPAGSGYRAHYVSGNVRIVLTHISGSYSTGTNLPSGTIIATLYPMGFTHLHMEVSIGGIWVKPENYFCN
ncbi:MAG: Gram positive anchor [Candidatus Amesbacteria bacterium GW2011_GWB1_47_19]|nr:MAG: Gram positive anchor [Candidatus Amesbacteria bacterium GW2011_GWB1_47_19]